MGKVVSIDQSHSLMSILSTNINWAELDGDLIQRLIDAPRQSGGQFQRFLQNGCCFNFGDLKVATAPFDPVKFPGLGKGWCLVPEEQDASSAALTEVDFGQAEFISGLHAGENVITGEEKLKRLKVSGRIRYGATVFMGLWNDYQSRKENSVLERLYRERQITWMDFPGDVLLGPDGNRSVLYFDRHGRRWYWDCYWLSRGWGASHPSAVSPPVSAAA